MAKQIGFYFDASACSGCKTCQVACKDKNDLGEGIRWRRVYEVSGGQWQQKDGSWHQNISAYFLSMSCNHCQDPICAQSCPTNALVKRNDGIVVIDPVRCMGCRYCEMACPYGAPQYDSEKGQMTKCDLCFDYLEAGKKPACVSACPTRALDFGEIETLQQKHKNPEQIYPLPDEKYCKPAFVVNPHPSDTDKSTLLNIENWEEVKNG